MMGKTAKILAFSCEHAPYTPPAHQDWLLGQIAKFKPDIIVHCGDRFESAAASVHPDEATHDLADEYEYAAKFSQKIRKQVPKARTVWILGNHDDNIQKKDARRVPKNLRSLVHWNKSEWGDEFRRWEQVPYVKDARGCFSIGQVVFMHGWNFSRNSDEDEAVEMNWWLGNGVGNRLFIRGHTHRPMPPTPVMYRGRTPLGITCANVGTVGPLKPGYMERQSTVMWGVACAKVECDPLARMGKAWDCEITHK